MTHDRYFLDQVTDEILAFDPRESHTGEIVTFAGLSQWESWRKEIGKVEKPAASSAEEAKPAKKKKLGYKETRELEGMEAKIHEVEKRIASLNVEIGLPANASNASKLSELYDSLADAQAELDRLYERWAELEALKNELGS